MAKEDPHEGVRSLAISNLGAVIDDVDPKLRREIANYIYYILTTSEPKYDKLDKQSAYHSVVVAMGIPPKAWPPLKLEPNIDELIDKDLLAKFCKKYNVQQKTDHNGKRE